MDEIKLDANQASQNTDSPSTELPSTNTENAAVQTAEQEIITIKPAESLSDQPAEEIKMETPNTPAESLLSDLPAEEIKMETPNTPAESPLSDLPAEEIKMDEPSISAEDMPAAAQDQILEQPVAEAPAVKTDENVFKLQEEAVAEEPQSETFEPSNRNKYEDIKEIPNYFEPTENPNPEESPKTEQEKIEYEVAPAKPAPEKATNLFKSNEELEAETSKDKRNAMLMFLAGGTVLLLVAAGVYFLKSGEELQGYATPPSIKTQQNKKLCDLNKYRPVDRDECIEIPLDDEGLIAELQENPMEYSIAHATTLETWWQTEAYTQEEQAVEEFTGNRFEDGSSYEDQASLETLEQYFASSENDPYMSETFSQSPSLVDDTGSTESTETNTPSSSPTHQSQPATGSAPQNECTELKKKASLLVDQGNVNEAYNTQVQYLKSKGCFPDFDNCASTLAQGITAKLYSGFAESINYDTAYLTTEFAQREKEYYSSCIDIETTCTAIRNNGFTANQSTNNLQSAIPLQQALSTSQQMQTEGSSSFSQANLEQKVMEALNRQNLLSEEEFLNKYCQTQVQTDVKKKVKRTK
jgi:hypothetical protein